MVTSVLLRRAANRLDRTGWKQRAMGGPFGPNCLVGALLWEADRDFGPSSPFARELVEEACAELTRFLGGPATGCPVPGCPVPDCLCTRTSSVTAVMYWNDKRADDKLAVTSALRECAAKLDGGTPAREIPTYMPPAWVVEQLPTVELAELALV